VPEPLSLPALSLIVLVGVAGSGKSTFAARHFGSTQIVSSDVCRALVADDDGDQSATPAAFDLVHRIAGHRLAAGRRTVVDATNVEAAARRPLLELAAEHDVPAIAIVLDLPLAECAARAAARGERTVPAEVVTRQHAWLRSGLPGLAAEGFRAVHVLHTGSAVAEAAVEIVPSPWDHRGDQGPFDVVGDVHGCVDELVELVDRLGYVTARDESGRVAGAHHPAGRRMVFVGDLVDRGPDPAGTLRLVMGMVAAGDALAIAGNHEYKLLRACGRAHGPAPRAGSALARTLDLLGQEPPEFRRAALDFCAALPVQLLLDGGRLVVAHAGLKEAYHGRDSPRVRSFALFGDTTGERDEHGFPVRRPWANEYQGRATVLYGHTPALGHRWVNNTLCLDTGCCFGGSLTALRYPERELVHIPAHRVHHPPARPLADLPSV
jgi:protein phosphatase